jgi:hypothetical protein
MGASKSTETPPHGGIDDKSNMVLPHYQVVGNIPPL